MSLKFEWSKSKAKANYAKHGVSFDMAKQVFRDPFAVEYLDDRQDYGEERWKVLGMAHGRLLLVVYTTRHEIIRIISARAAEPYEWRRYHEENAQDG